jgi:hypothetical protein
MRSARAELVHEHRSPEFLNLVRDLQLDQITDIA